MGDAVVGVVANPLSGRDIRRLVTQASVFPTAEKANMIQRMLTAFGAVGVQRVLLSTDLGGISASVFRAIGRCAASRPGRTATGRTPAGRRSSFSATSRSGRPHRTPWMPSGAW